LNPWAVLFYRSAVRVSHQPLTDFFEPRLSRKAGRSSTSPRSTYRFACLAGQNWAKMGACGKVTYWTGPDDWTTGLRYRALLICDSKFVENRPRKSLH
jgi:hypothetical protein